MSTVTLYSSGPPTGLDLGVEGAVVTNYGPGTVSYSDAAEPFVEEGTIAASASATLTGTQFFRAMAGAVLGLDAVREGSTEAQIAALEARTLAVESDQATGLPSKVNRARVNTNLQDYTDLDGGTDNTTALNARIAALGDLATASKPKTLRLGEGVLLTAGVVPAANVVLDARGCHVKKVGNDGTPQGYSLVRWVESVGGSGPWLHRSLPGFKIVGGVWDANGYACQAGMIRLLFTEGLELDGLTVLYTPRVAVNIGTTNGSPIITGPASTFTTINDANRAVSGAGIPDGARIDTVQSATQATMNVNATATATITLTLGTVWGMATGGRDGYVHHVTTRLGTMITQDGPHHCHGPRWTYAHNDIECGDDPLAIGQGSSNPYLAAEAANGTLDAISHIGQYDNRCKSWRGNAVRAYAEAGDTEPEWKITDIDITGVMGQSGILRNGGVVIDSHLGDDGRPMVERVNVQLGSLTVGSTGHLGVNNRAIQIHGAGDIHVGGELVLVEGAGLTGTDGLTAAEVHDSPDVTLDFTCGALAGRHGVEADNCPRLVLGDRLYLRQTAGAQAAMPVVQLKDCPGVRLRGKILDVQDGHSGILASLGTTTSLDVDGATIAHASGATTGEAIAGVSTAMTHLGVHDGSDLSGSPAGVSAAMRLLPSLVIGDNVRGLSGRRLKRVEFDDFNGPPLALLGPVAGVAATFPTRWAYRVGTDTGTIVPPGIPAVVQLEGAFFMSTGDDAAANHTANGVQLLTAKNWRPDKGGLVCEFALKTSGGVNSMCLFAGWTDDSNLIRPPFQVAAADALSFYANNACGVLYDTAADTDNWWACGVAAGVAAAKQNLGVAPVLNVYDVWRIEVSPAGIATFRRNGQKIGAPMAGALSAVGVAFTIVMFSRGAAVRGVYGDYVLCEENRSA